MGINAVVNGSDLAGTICARFLDAYGDAVFNQAQIPILAQELEGLSAASRDKPVREHLAAVSELARKAVGHVHTYCGSSEIESDFVVRPA